MYSYFSKGRDKNYLYGCGAPDCDNDVIDEEREELPDCFEDMTPLQQRYYLYKQEEIRKRQMLADLHSRRDTFIQHQREEGKIK